MGFLETYTNIYNINVLGMGFMLVFSAFITASSMEATIFKDLKGHNGISQNTGFYSLGIIYACLGVANFFSPSFVHMIGTRASLFLSALPYTGFIFCLYNPYIASVFILSAMLGFSGAVIWTANGEVIAKNSPGETKAKNTGIFWMWFNTSMLLGNIFIFFYLGESEHISDSQRHTISLVLGGLSTVGTISFLLMRKPTETGNVINESESESILQPLKDALRFSKSWQLLFLYAPIIFTGVSLNFWSSVFVTIIGSSFPKRSYLALGGMFTGTGEILAGFIWGRLTNYIGRHGVVMLSCIINCAVYFVVFISFPFDATVSVKAEMHPIIESNIYLTCVLAVFLGIGDGGFNISIYSALSTIFEEKPAPVFAIFKLVQSLVGAIAFLYCGHVILPYQLLILSLSCLAGALSFIKLEERPDINNITL